MQTAEAEREPVVSTLCVYCRTGHRAQMTTTTYLLEAVL